MSDDLVLHGKQYVSSKKAAEESGYVRDYIGQLSRGGLVDAQRVGGLWYVSMESLSEYKKNTDQLKSAISPTSALASAETESSVSFEGKDYISASRASKTTGYNQDYIGQLARAQKIPSRQIGNRWYVQRDALINHKTEKDALLAAVQADAVGLSRIAPATSSKIQAAPLTYFADSRDLMPVLSIKPSNSAAPLPITPDHDRSERRIPIRTMQTSTAPRAALSEKPLRPSNRPRRGYKVVLAEAGTALTIVLLLSYGALSIREGTLYTMRSTDESVATERNTMTAGALEAFRSIGDMIENFLSPELKYER